MSIQSYWYGHPIEYSSNGWIFVNTGEPIPEHTPENAGSGQYGVCVHCKKPPTKEGHDACLGTLPVGIVMNACCGHGRADQAYIQYWDGGDVRGYDALIEIKNLKGLEGK